MSAELRSRALLKRNRNLERHIGRAAEISSGGCHVIEDNMRVSGCLYKGTGCIDCVDTPYDFEEIIWSVPVH